MNADEYQFFNALNDTILLTFDNLTPWEKVYITDLHHRAMTKQLISEKQKELGLKIIEKRKKKRRR